MVDPATGHERVLTCALYILIACPLALISFHEQVGAREEPYRLVQTTGLKDAIVILDTSSAMGMAPQDLVRNQPSLDQPVLYARRDVDVSELHRRFPSRTIWTYQRPYPAEPGRLVPITTTQ